MTVSRTASNDGQAILTLKRSLGSMHPKSSTYSSLLETAENPHRSLAIDKRYQFGRHFAMKSSTSDWGNSFGFEAEKFLTSCFHVATSVLISGPRRLLGSRDLMVSIRLLIAPAAPCNEHRVPCRYEEDDEAA